MLSFVWPIVICAFAIVVLAAAWFSASRRIAVEDLGAVSDGWLAHHRVDGVDLRD